MKITLQYIVFAFIQILFIPFAVLGLILCAYKEFIVSKKLGVSVTAGGAIKPRWFLHYFGTRLDEATIKFVKALPTDSHFGFLGIFGAALIANRICGFKPSFTKIPEPGMETFTDFVIT